MIQELKISNKWIEEEIRPIVVLAHTNEVKALYDGGVIIPFG
jgi:hypothetical protein